MSSETQAVSGSRPGTVRYRPQRRGMAVGIVAGNAAVIVILWLRGISGLHGIGDVLISLGRITGLLAAYLALIQVLLLARLRRLEQLVGFDRLTVWHRINGKVCLYLVLAHVILTTWGYAYSDRLSIPSEISTLFRVYTGIIAATVGMVLFILVVVTSLVMVRRQLRYEAWYAVHLMSYAAIALAWFHQIPTGNEFILNQAAATYWRALYLTTLILVLGFRIALPIINGFRYQLRVAEVTDEGPNVVSLRLTGRRLDRMRVQAGQFFLWRFMTWKLVWQSHPFSLSAAPDGQSLRITIKSLGDFTSRIAEIRPGTRVMGVGPFGLFTDAVRRLDRVALIAGGVGITPIRGLLEVMTGDVVLVYRVTSRHEVVFRDELEGLVRDRGIQLHYVTGSRSDPGGDRLLSAKHLQAMIPDIARREVFVCGPAAMSNAVEVNAERAGVPRKYIHSESFAFSPDVPIAKETSGGHSRARRSIFGFTMTAAAAITAGLSWLAIRAMVTTPAANSVAAPPTISPTASKPAGAVVTPVATRAAAKKVAPVPVTSHYAGSVVGTQYGSVQAILTVTGKRITDVVIAVSPDSGRSQSIEAGALPTLKSETLAAQNAAVNLVSGATFTSNGYIQSLRSALAKGHL